MGAFACYSSITANGIIVLVVTLRAASDALPGRMRSTEPPHAIFNGNANFGGSAAVTTVDRAHGALLACASARAYSRSPDDGLYGNEMGKT